MEKKSTINTYITLLLLSVSIIILFLKIEISFLKICLKSIGKICLTGDVSKEDLLKLANVGKGWDDSLTSLAGGADLFIIAITASIVGLFISIVAIMVLPNSLQVTGDFEKFGGRIKFGGAAGLVLLFAGGGFLLAWQGIPAASTTDFAKKAFNALSRAHTSLAEQQTAKIGELRSTMEDQYGGLSETYKGFGQNQSEFVKQLSNYEREILFKLLNEGFVGKLNTTITISCKQGSNSNDLLLVTRRAPAPIEPINVTVQMRPTDADKSMATIFVAKRDNIDKHGLAKSPVVVIEYVPRESKSMEGLAKKTERSVQFILEVDQANLDDYCDSQNSSIAMDTYQ